MAVSGTGCIRKYLRLKCGFEWKGLIFQNFIVSFVQPIQAINLDAKNNQFDPVTDGDSIHWVCVLPRNVSDINHPVKCFTIFRCF